MISFRAAGIGLLLVAAASCTPPPGPKPPVEVMWPVMGTFVTVAVPAGAAERIQAVSDEVREHMDGLERRLSLFRADSELTAVNRGAGAWVSVSPPTAALVQQCRFYSELSDGAFDATVSPLVRFWGFNGGSMPEAVPAPEAIAAVRALTGWQGIEVTGAAVRLARPGMELDLGAIAKGYAVDLCYDAVMEGGPLDVLVNLGGNMRAYGGNGNQPYWRVGVRNPFERDEVVGVVALTDGTAMATSGNYERFVEIEGRRYAHIIDPRTGMPVEGMAGVTVVAPTAMEADALSTALFVAGMPAAEAILKARSGVQAVFIPDRRPMEIWITRGLENRFVPVDGLEATVHVLRF